MPNSQRASLEDLSDDLRMNPPLADPETRWRTRARSCAGPFNSATFSCKRLASIFDAGTTNGGCCVGTPAGAQFSKSRLPFCSGVQLLLLGSVFLNVGQPILGLT